MQVYLLALPFPDYEFWHSPFGTPFSLKLALPLLGSIMHITVIVFQRNGLCKVEIRLLKESRFIDLKEKRRQELERLIFLQNKTKKNDEKHITSD